MHEHLHKHQIFSHCMKTPIRLDRSIIEFIHHWEHQIALQWNSWEPMISYPMEPMLLNLENKMEQV
jgi:hypothetical protein